MNSMIEGSFAPQSYRPAPHLDTLATAYHLGVAKTVCRQLRRFPPLAPLLEQALAMAARTPVTAAAWQPELGTALRTAGHDAPDQAIVNLLFALHALRVTGAWDYTLAAPLRASVAGHLFNVAGRIAVHADAAGITIRRGDSATAPLVLQWGAAGLHCAQAADPAWRHSAPHHLARPDLPHSYLQSCALPRSATLPEVILTWPIAPLEAEHPALAATSAPQVGAAFDLLAQAGPGYVPWLAPLFRGMATAPLFTPNMRQSESMLHHPGVISCGFPSSTEFLAEVLVHEVSHQHYFLVNTVVPLTDRSATDELYFSTLKGRRRSIDKILLTYHATANMLLYWHDVIDGLGMATLENLKEKAGMQRHVAGLTTILDNAAGLTAAGTAMFRHQRRLLDERGYRFAPH